MGHMENFLTREEQEKVIACVKQAERTTSCEIVPMVVSASSSYQMSAVLASLFVVLPLLLVFTEALRVYGSLDRAGLYLFLLLSAGGCSCLYYLMVKEGKLTGLLRHFLLEQDVEEEVEKAALAAFYSEGLHRTAEENGILLYISVLERKLWILADRSINEKIDESEWEKIIQQVGRDIYAGEPGCAICRAVDAVAALVGQYFPYRVDDKDELSNLVVGK